MNMESGNGVHNTTSPWRAVTAEGFFCGRVALALSAILPFLSVLAI